MSDQSKGLLLAVIGVLILSPDSLLIRLIAIDLWTLTFLRGCFMALSMFALNLLVHKSGALTQFLHLDKYAGWIAVLMAIDMCFFVAAIQTTSVAHTLIIIGAVPVVAAILALFVFKQKLPVHTRWTIGIVFISLIFVVYDDAKSNLVGDVYAMVACILLACIFILARKTTVANMLAPMCLSGVLIALISLPQLALQSIRVDQMLLSMVLGLLVGLAFALINLAPRYIPSTEVAIFMPLEAVIGTLLVWWFLGEYPGSMSIIAGLIIVSALIMNSYWQLKQR